jgi:hypothetical protein
MCGAKSYAAIAQWGQDQEIAMMHLLGFTRKPPKLGGIRKVLIALNLRALEEALTRWAEMLLSRPIPSEFSPPEAFALDGKSARGSFDGLEKAVRLLSLMAHESGLTLAQTAVPNGGENKTNEHKTALRLLEGIVLEGRLITGDAMFCQRDLSQQVIDAQGGGICRGICRHPPIAGGGRIGGGIRRRSASMTNSLARLLEWLRLLERSRTRIKRRPAQ